MIDGSIQNCLYLCTGYLRRDIERDRFGTLIETAQGNGEYVLSAAYDMLSTNVVIPSDPEQLALTICGKKQHIRRKDFVEYASAIGLMPKAAEKMMENIVKQKEKYISMCRESYLPEDKQEALIALIMERISVLER